MIVGPVFAVRMVPINIVDRHDPNSIVCPLDVRLLIVSALNSDQNRMQYKSFLFFPLTAIDTLSGYLQCTPPPPADYDPNPKVCNNTLDCFPNVCCQEAGKKHCRPPKRSLLAFLTTFAQVRSVNGVVCTHTAYQL